MGTLRTQRGRVPSVMSSVYPCPVQAHAQLCPTLCEPVDYALQAPPSVGFPRQESGVPCYFLLQGIFPTQGWNPRLLHWQVDSLPLSHHKSPLCVNVK